MPSAFRPIDPGKVTLAPGSRYAAAQEAGERYVLALDPDRLLAPYREECGVPRYVRPDGTAAHRYPNWESMGMGGHIGGHYLSALAGFWQATRRDVFRARAAYVLDAFDECQRAHGDGYVGGVPDGDRLFAELRKGHVEAQSFDLDGSWVPLYNLHKTFAGILDCARTFHGMSEGRLAMRMARGWGDWWIGLTEGMSEDAFQSMLVCEFGGLNESLAQLGAMTGDDRYVRAARRFDEHVLFGDLSAGRDRLTGMHANTQIPKVLGYDAIASLTGDVAHRTAVDTFWESVTGRRSVSIGAHSVAEHFNPVDDFGPMIVSRQGVETCNSYNMSKLAERRFLNTGEARYLDFYERVLENHILSTVGVNEGGFVYFTPMRPRHYRVYSSVHESFWCCVGSGLENHARYGRLIYAAIEPGQPGHAGSPADGAEEPGLAVNLFVPSSLRWDEAGLLLEQRYGPGDALEDVGRLDLTSAEGGAHGLRLYVRRPWWAEETTYTFEGGVGETSDDDSVPGYDCLHLSWDGHMTVHLRRQVRLGLERMPDGSPWVSVLRGATVMAFRDRAEDIQGLQGDDSRAGHIASGPMRRMGDLPVLVGRGVTAAGHRGDGLLEAEVSVPGTADGEETERTMRIVLEPFAGIEASRYSIYLPWSEDGDVASVRRMLRDIDDRESSYEQRICDEVRCGEQQSEVDHRYEGDFDRQGYVDGRHCRRAMAGGFFGYSIKDWERTGDCLCVVLLPEDANLEYALTVNDVPAGPRVRDEEDGLVIDRYAVEHGALGVGDGMASRVVVSAPRDGEGPRVVRIGLMRGVQ